MKVKFALIATTICAATFAAGRPAYAATSDTGTAADSPVAADAGASPAPASSPADSPVTATATSATTTPVTGFWDRATLFGDFGGLRSALGNVGVTIGLQETSELLGNVTGGLRRAAAYDGMTEVSLGVDGDKALAWSGATFNVSALQIHGRNLSALYLDNLQISSNIEAEQATRLWELWVQQSLFDNKLDIKIGQQSLDQEFMTSQYGGTFINSAFGWPVLAASDMLGGGPAYPLASLGVRIRGKLTDAVTILGGVFDGDPAGISATNMQQSNRSGTNFNLHNGALFIAEMQYAVNQPTSGGSANAQSTGLPGTYKIGAWYDSDAFADQRYDTQGVSLADPASNGIAAEHRGDYSFYAVADQMVWQASADSPQSVGIFARVTGAPGDRNPVSLSMNAGAVLKAPFKGRDNDALGLGIGYAKFSGGANGYDQDYARYDVPGFPARTGETYLELTYQYQVTPWWQIQSDLQYTLNVGGNATNPNPPGQKIGNELVLGLRTAVTF